MQQNSTRRKLMANDKDEYDQGYRHGARSTQDQARGAREAERERQKRDQEFQDRLAAQQQKQTQAAKPCFVATAAFGNCDAPEVIFLRAYRDESLSRNALGRAFIQTYYVISPSLAAVIAKSELLRAVVRKFFLQPTIFLLDQRAYRYRKIRF
jgi:hypothetical protein